MADSTDAADARDDLARPAVDPHRGRPIVVWGVAVLVGLLVGLGTALAVRALRSSPTTPTTPTGRPLPDHAVEIAGPPDAAGTPTGAAALGLTESAPAVGGLDDGTWITEVGALLLSEPPNSSGAPEPPAGTAGSVPAATSTAPTGTTPAGTEPSGASTPPDLASVATELGQVELGSGTMVLSQFVDTCAEGAQPCPAGQGGTVLPFAGGAGDGMGGGGLEIRLWPGLNGLTTDQLTCEPGYATSTRLPLVVTADAPLLSIAVTLRIDGVGELDSVYRTVTDPKVIADWTARAQAGQPIGTDLNNSIHYCFSLRTEGDPLNAAALAGTKLPAGATYTIDVKALAASGPDQAGATATMAVPTTFDRPPTTIWPLSTHRAQVAVPQIGGNSGQTRVWAEGPAYTDRDCSTFGPTFQESIADFEAGYPSATPRKLWPPHDPYPYDRFYDHFTVWNLVLRDTTDYVLCVQWRDAAGAWGPTETWTVQTPDALHLDVWVSTFAAPGALKADHWSVAASQITGCNRFVVDVESVDYSSGTDTEACRSRGWPVPVWTTLSMERLNSKTGAYDQMGTRSFLTPTVCEGVFGPGGAKVAGFSYSFACGPKTDSITVHWATDDNTLCGGPWGSCAGDSVEATMTGELRLYRPWWASGRTGSTNWGIAKVDATYGTGLTGGGQSLP